MAARKPRLAGTAEPDSEILSYEEVNARYPGEWVLFKVIRRNEQGAISHGQVITHHRQRRMISKAWGKLWEKEPHTPVAIFLGGTRRVNGQEFRRIIEEVMQRDDYVNARW